MNRKRLIVAGVVVFLACSILAVVLGIKQSRKRATTTAGYHKDPDTGETLFSDPRQTPTEQNPPGEPTFMSLVGTDPLTKLGVTPAQMESLRKALSKYFVSYRNELPTEAAIIKSKDALKINEDRSIDINIKFRPQNVTVAVKLYATDLGTSIYVGNDGPIYGEEALRD